MDGKKAVYIKQGTHARFKTYCVYHGNTSMSKVLDTLLVEWLEAMEKKGDHNDAPESIQ